MRDKQYLTAIRPLEGALAMSTMRFADEVVPRSEIDGLPRRTKPDTTSLRMATQLLDALAADWEPKRYHDTYTEEVRGRIEAKRTGKATVADEPVDEPTAEIVDLMAALEASVEAAKSGRKRTGRSKVRTKSA